MGEHLRAGAIVAVTACLLLSSVAETPAQSAKPAYDPRTAFAATDTNHDGAVDHEEFSQRLTEVFYSADVDKNGSLSVVECSATLVQTDNLAAADSNQNGTLTLHEFMRARFNDFELVDRNRDGLLQQEEVVAVFEE